MDEWAEVGRTYAQAQTSESCGGHVGRRQSSCIGKYQVHRLQGFQQRLEFKHTAYWDEQ